MNVLKKYGKASMLLVAGLAVSLTSSGQMGAAQRVEYDIDTAAKFNVAVSILWDAVKEPAKWADFSNGYISSIIVNGNVPDQTRVVRFADGSERKDVVLQYQPEYKFMVMKITDPLNKAITDNILVFTSVADGQGRSKLEIRIKADGDEKEKTAFLNALRKEMNNYMIGLAKRFAAM